MEISRKHSKKSQSGVLGEISFYAKKHLHSYCQYYCGNNNTVRFQNHVYKQELQSSDSPAMLLWLIFLEKYIIATSFLSPPFFFFFLIITVIVSLSVCFYCWILVWHRDPCI